MTFLFPKHYSEYLRHHLDTVRPLPETHWKFAFSPHLGVLEEIALSKYYGCYSNVFNSYYIYTLPNTLPNIIQMPLDTYQTPPDTIKTPSCNINFCLLLRNNITLLELWPFEASQLLSRLPSPPWRRIIYRNFSSNE